MPVIAAVGSAVHCEDAQLARRLEQAARQAVLDALAEGVSINDSKELLARKQAACDRVRETR